MARSQPHTPPSDTTDPLAPEDGARRRHIPTMRAIVIAATVLGVLDTSLLRASGAAWVRAILGGVLMGTFIVFGMRAIVRLRLRYRPQHRPPEERDPSAPPPRGGWATQTAGQSMVARIGRAASGLRRPRPPRDRRDRRSQ